MDNIIFGLQRFGGISNYWERLARAMICEESLSVRFVAPSKTMSQIERPLPFLPAQQVSEILPANVSRYLSFDVGTCGVAHTSYYRLPRQHVDKYIVTAYDFMYERYRKGPASWAHSWQKRRSLTAADLVICISTFTRDEALHWAPNLDPGKLVVIPLGVDVNVFFPEPKTSQSALSRTVLFVGERGGYKRFDLALGAIAQVRDLNLGVVGPRMDEKEKECAEKLIPGRWTELGRVNNEELRHLYSSAFALVYPSDCEGFGLPVLEAMACGCPVICSKRGSLPEVGGEAAFFADEQDPQAYAEKLRLLEDESERQFSITSGAKNIKRYAWERTIRETLAHYKL